MVELLLDRKQCDPFEPSHWVRAVDVQYTPSITRLFVDCQLDNPNCELVGLMLQVDVRHKIEKDIDQDSLIPRTHPKSILVKYRNKHFAAAIRDVVFSDEAIHDLKAVHDLDAMDIIAEIFTEDVVNWLENNSLAAIPRRQEQQT